jgi:hypothetical protein
MQILKWKLILTAILLCLCASSGAKAACDQRAAKSIADRVTSEIAIMIQFTKAACIPTADAQKCSLLCLSDLRIEGMKPQYRSRLYHRLWRQEDARGRLGEICQHRLCRS